MPKVRIYRARIDVGEGVSGLVFSYDRISNTDSVVDGQHLKISQVERFYIEVPPGFELCVINGQKYTRDPDAGEDVYMRAARVVSRVWQDDPGFRIIPPDDYQELDQELQM